MYCQFGNRYWVLTRSRCDAGTLSTPLSWSRARSLPSHNSDNYNMVSDTTHLPRKTVQRSEKLSKPVATYSSIASNHQPFSRDRRGSHIFVSDFHHRHRSIFTTTVHHIICSIIGIITLRTHTIFVGFIFVCLIRNLIVTGHLTEEFSPANWGRVSIGY
jgi:hypothetical protein